MRILSLVMFLGFGCRDKEVTTVEEDIRSDLDGDGFTDDVDCDDLDRFHMDFNGFWQAPYRNLRVHKIFYDFSNKL